MEEEMKKYFKKVVSILSNKIDNAKEDILDEIYNLSDEEDKDELDEDIEETDDLEDIEEEPEEDSEEPTKEPSSEPSKDKEIKVSRVKVKKTEINNGI